METIPSRASDAGPERAEQIPDWRDHIEDARYEIDWVASYRSEKDDIKAEREMRLLRLRNAMDELKKVEAMLLAGER